MIPPLSETVITYKCSKCGSKNAAWLMNVCMHPIQCGICNNKEWITSEQIIDERRSSNERYDKWRSN